MSRVTLRSLRADHPRLFYPHGAPLEWFRKEAFYDAPLEEPLDHLPVFLMAHPRLPDDSLLLVSAVQLAELYVRTPEDECWNRFLWTSDTDDFGQRVYVGGCDQGRPRGFQIHRHLALTDRWAMALFQNGEPA